MPKKGQKRVRKNEREHRTGSIKDYPNGDARAWRPPQADGKRPSKLFHPPDARQQAEKWLKGIEPGPSMTLELWTEIWCTRRFPTLRENTRHRYERYFEHLAPLARRQLVAITVDDWQAHINLLLFGDQDLPAAQRFTLAWSTVDRARGIWSAALTAAVRAGHLKMNPLLDTVLPTKAEKIPRAWRADEVRRMLASARGHHHEAFLHLGLGTGARLGELRALEWTDVDFENLTVTISKSVDNATSEPGPTKSGKVRNVPLPEETAAFLAAHCKRQPPGTRHVLGRPKGPYAAATYRRWLAIVCEAAKASPLPPHSMRHTFASLSLADNRDLPALSAVLGHASIIITGQVYAHWITQEDRPTARAISHLIYGAPDRSARKSAQSGAPDQEKLRG